MSHASARLRLRRTVSPRYPRTALIAALLIGNAASAQLWSTHDYTANLEPIGESERATGVFNTDMAFWGDRLYQGTYDGFRIIDISDPANPVSLNDYAGCSGDQGDMVVWGDTLVRSWNSTATFGATCDGQLVPTGFQGLHVFDVSDPANPQLVASVATACGSHTATGVPDLANDRLLIYNSGSSSTCPWIDIVEVPLSNPAASVLLGVALSGRSCHDTGVILGDAMLATCAGGNGFTVFSIGGLAGGSLTNPLMLYSKTVPGVSIGHSASYSWDGEVLIFGHEPGGGSGARCQASSATVDKTLFFYKASDGTDLGQWVLTRPQGSTENCTLHNYNVVPTPDRDILVMGNYQAGVWVLDFTDPSAVSVVAYADPDPLPSGLGGDWSSYWYDGHIYESDITRGLIVWRLDDPVVAGARTLGHLNPQTQEFTEFPPLDTDGDSIEDDVDNCPLVANAGQEDADSDGVGDVCDNCLLEPNPDQCNTNGNGNGPGEDNFGNHCDADLDNNGIVNSFDVSIMRNNFGATGPNDADLDCNGSVNSFDLSRMRDRFGAPPGPTGIGP